MKNEYRRETEQKMKIKIKENLQLLPPFAEEFVTGMILYTTASTRLSYTYDLSIFFTYLRKTCPIYKNFENKDFTLSQLERLKPQDIREFLDYLSDYENKDGRQIYNSEAGQARKLSTLRAFYHFFIKNESIKYNPAAAVRLPKIREKTIVRLYNYEVQELLDKMESGTLEASKHQKVYFEKYKYRDIALITILLGTGIRVSECVGLDITHINFKQNNMELIRKGKKETTLKFNEEVEIALKNYIELERFSIMLPGSGEKALFLSSKGTRMTTRTVERLVNRYTSFVRMHGVSPHKLRSTYATELYRDTGDIYAVRNALGHDSVETSKKYADSINEKLEEAITSHKIRKTK